MEEKSVATIGLFAGIIIFSIIFMYVLAYDVENQQVYNKDSDIDFTYMPHYVKLHITPEKEGISVAAWASDEFSPTSGYTNKNSEIVFPMISSAKYNILIDNNRCSYYIYPVDSYYDIACGELK